MQKMGENNQKVGKIGQAISQTPIPRPEHDKIWAQWDSDVPMNSMLEKVWYVNVLRWNLEVESFVAWWVIQMEEDTHELGW